MIILIVAVTDGIRGELGASRRGRKPTSYQLSQLRADGRSGKQPVSYAFPPGCACSWARAHTLVSSDSTGYTVSIYMYTLIHR